MRISVQQLPYLSVFLAGVALQPFANWLTFILKLSRFSDGGTDNPVMMKNEYILVAAGRASLPCCVP